MLRIIFYNIVSFIIILIFEIILTLLPVNQGYEFMKLIKINLTFKI